MVAGRRCGVGSFRGEGDVKGYLLKQTNKIEGNESNQTTNQNGNPETLPHFAVK